MGYYLLDNPPASSQFYPSRNNGWQGGIVIHTTEGVGGYDSAENTAAFISRRSDPGSYHVITDLNGPAFASAKANSRRRPVQPAATSACPQISTISRFSSR